MTRVALLLLLAVPAVALAQEGAAPVSSVTRAVGVASLVSATLETREVLALVQQGNLRAACERSRAGAALLTRPVAECDADPRLRPLAIVHAIACAAAFFEDGKGDAAEVRRSIQAAAERARPGDLPLLRALETASHRTAPYARVVARRACGLIDETLEPRLLVALLRSSDAEIRRRAQAAIAARLARIRDKVNAGGDLDAQEQRELSDPALISSLIDALAERAVGADPLCHDVAARACPSALHALALIESPAIPALEAARGRGTPGAEEALAAVRAAAVERLRRHPRSSWSSASGALPQVVPGAIACGGCARPLPDAARFCPSCGASAPGVHCPRCGHLGLSQPCSRCGAVDRTAVPLCSRCGEELAPEHVFCKRCGTKREGGLAREERPRVSEERSASAPR